MRKKWNVIGGLVALMFSFTACGQKTEDASAASQTQTTITENVSTTESTAPETLEQPATTETPEVPMATELPVADTSEPEDGLIAGTKALELKVPENTDILNSCGGVVVTRQNGMYGAVNYMGDVLVPNKYDYYTLTPNEDGYFVLGQMNDEGYTAYVFDITGAEKLAIDNADRLKLYEDKIIYTCQQYDSEKGMEWGSVTLYDLSKKTVIFQEEDFWDAEEPNGFIPTMTQSGEFWYTNMSGSIYRIVTDASGKGNAELIQAFEADYEYLWSVFSEGFAMGNGVLDVDKAFLTNEDRTQLYNYDPYAIWNSEYYDEAYKERQYFDNGLYKYNKGKLFVISHEDTAANKTYYHMVNLEKAVCNEDGRVQNYDDVVVATYDYIQLSDSPYYLAGDNDKFFYIDANGKKVHDSFVDYSSFYKGYAMIIDTDGRAYMIDDAFQKVAGGYEADSVSTMGGIFCVEKEGKKLYLTAPGEQNGNSNSMQQANVDSSNMKADEELVKQAIINDVAKYNQFIYDHCGYPESEYGDGPHAKEANPDLKIVSLTNGVMEYMDYLIDYIAGKEVINAFLVDIEESAAVGYYTPLETQIKEMRGCVFTQTPYNQTHDDQFQDYEMILKNFLEDGHPDIETIDSISIESLDKAIPFDTHSCHIIATFTSNDITYKCYLSGNDSTGYKVLDLDKQE